jgi:hypothetical protein
VSGLNMSVRQQTLLEVAQRLVGDGLHKHACEFYQDIFRLDKELWELPLRRESGDAAVDAALASLDRFPMQKLFQIKNVRERSGLGLKEAKELVEKVWAAKGIDSEIRSTP